MEYNDEPSFNISTIEAMAKAYSETLAKNGFIFQNTHRPNHLPQLINNQKFYLRQLRLQTPSKEKARIINRVNTELLRVRIPKVSSLNLNPSPSRPISLKKDIISTQLQIVLHLLHRLPKSSDSQIIASNISALDDFVRSIN